MDMYKEYMLKCENWNPLEGKWERADLYFDTEKEMKEYIEFQGQGIKVEAMFRLTKIN